MKKEVPSFRPIEIEKRTAGSSKIPCGSNLQRINNPSLATTTFETYPRIYPFEMVMSSGAIPKPTPKTKAKKEA